jgi:hypothetical protein
LWGEIGPGFLEGKVGEITKQSRLVYQVFAIRSVLKSAGRPFNKNGRNGVVRKRIGKERASN